MFGKALHDFLTLGGLSQVEGLSEGFGDYVAMSYSRSLNLWSKSEDEYDWVFPWDGHNQCEFYFLYTDFFYISTVFTLLLNFVLCEQHFCC